MSRCIAPALLLVACMLAAPAPASAAPLVRLDVVDRDTGAGLPAARGHDRDWIAGVPGHRYGVRLANTTGARVLVVLSIDGVNAITGDTAHPSQAGYVLEPWQATEITGWRKSDANVAQFVFTDLGASYAARTGRPDNIGTIGIAVFREASAAAPRLPVTIAGSAATHAERRQPLADAAAPGLVRPAPDSRTPAPAPELGTGHGPRAWSPVGSTHFERAGRSPDQLTELRYDRRERLVARGLLPPADAPTLDRSPAAFPGHFVADPPAYR